LQYTRIINVAMFTCRQSGRPAFVTVARAGFDSDLIVRSGLALFSRVWLGHIEYDAATRCRSVVVEGIAALAKQLPHWFLWSPMARFVREREHAVSHAAGRPVGV
jgi:hypothetical protein